METIQMHRATDIPRHYPRILRIYNKELIVLTRTMTTNKVIKTKAVLNCDARQLVLSASCSNRCNIRRELIFHTILIEARSLLFSIQHHTEAQYNASLIATLHRIGSVLRTAKLRTNLPAVMAKHSLTDWVYWCYVSGLLNGSHLPACSHHLACKARHNPCRRHFNFGTTIMWTFEDWCE